MKRWINRFGAAGFCFFLVKGLVWLAIGGAAASAPALLKPRPQHHDPRTSIATAQEAARRLGGPYDRRAPRHDHNTYPPDREPTGVGVPASPLHPTAAQRPPASGSTPHR
jgi:hypothetical protein